MICIKIKMEGGLSGSKTRTYSRYSTDAALLLGRLIRLGRKERKMTAQEVAERAGISRGTVQRIEAGNLKCEIGLIFEVAVIVGVNLFDSDISALGRSIESTSDKIALLPKSIRKKQKAVDDDF